MRVSALSRNDVATPTNDALFESIACPLCGGKEFATIFEAKSSASLSSADFLSLYRSSSDAELHERLVECRHCNLGFLNPRVLPEIVLKSYSDAVDPTFVTQNETRIATFRRALARILKVTGMEAAKSTRVLDIGCAGGAFPKAVADAGMSVVGIEPSKWLSDYGKRTYGVDIRAGTLDDHHFPPGSFDLITLWDVIEHVHDPVALLQKCRTLLKKDGTLVLNYPDFGSRLTKLMGRKWPFFLSVHLFYFTRTSIQTALGKAGLEAFRFQMHWQTLQTSYVLKRASAYFPFLRRPVEWFSRSPLAMLPFTYYMGQTTVYSRRRD